MKNKNINKKLILIVGVLIFNFNLVWLGLGMWLKTLYWAGKQIEGGERVNLEFVTHREAPAGDLNNTNGGKD